METCNACKLGGNSGAPEQFCPHMSDRGRLFTNFKPRCYNLPPQGMSSYDQRMYFMENAEKLINQDRADLFARVGCYPCYCYEDQGTLMPEHARMECDARTCTMKITNPCGVGLGRVNTSLDVKFDTGVMEVPFYPINGVADGKFASASRYSFLDTSMSS